MTGRGTASERLRRALVEAALALPCLLGCAQIAGTDEYQVGVEPKSDPPPLDTPPPPFLAGSEECQACAADTCGKELAACDADDVCKEWLGDLRERPDPLSAYERYRIENELLWQSAHGEPGDTSIANVRECAQKCMEACPVGQNFSCVGQFEWDLPRPEVLKARVSFLSFPLTSQVSACLNADQCEDPLDSQQTDEAGFAELRFDAGATARGAISYLHVATSDFMPWQWVQTRPLADDDYIQFDLISDATFRSWHQGFGQSFDAGQGVLLVVPADCSGVHAKQVALEAWFYAEGRPTFCEDCFYAYGEDANEAPNAELTAFVTTGRAGYIANVPPGVVYVVLRRLAEPRDVLSVARVLVQGDDLGVVRLYPASQRDLKSFPDPRK